jgi:DNA-binding transcriptional ArsR family regulator
LPSLPRSAGTAESIILQTLLLHGGATAELLELLLPLSHNQVRHALHQLMEANLVELKADGRWRVTLLGYPAVWQFIENEGYLVDAF